VARNLLQEPRVGGIVVYYRDVTSRKATEQQLKETEDRSGHLVSAAADVIFEADAEGYFRVVNPQTRTATLRAVLSNRGGIIKPGMLLSVTIESQPRTGPAVPELALVREGNSSFVYTIGPDQKAKRLPVLTGRRDGNLVEIVTGLEPGDRIVTEGVVKLSEDIKVRTDKKPSGAAPGKAK